ncbi:MAG TPA: DinB family protein [Rhizomicrobium sp.]|nr:DinB family protein [Rhizomicrobium sp.]
MGNSFLVSLFEHKAWCNLGLVEALRRVPDDADRVQFNTILVLLGHTSIVDQIFKARLSGTEHEFRAVVGNDIPELERLASTLAETDAWYLDYVKDLSASELDDVVEFDFVSDSDHGRMTKAEILAHIIAHGASHRGAIGRIMETLKVRGAPDMVTTFVRQTSAKDREER